MKTIEEILRKQRPQNNLVDSDTSVANALSIMKTGDLSYVVVLKNDTYAGIFTERDYAQKVILMGKPAHTVSVGDVMSSNLPTLALDDTIENCMMLMNAYKTRYLPVFDDYRFLTVVTMSDLISISMSKECEELVGHSSEKVF